MGHFELVAMVVTGAQVLEKTRLLQQAKVQLVEATGGG